MGIFRPITKWNTSIASPDIIPEVVRKAFKIAENEKPGAAHLELPEDVAKMKTNSRPIPVVEVRRPDPDIPALQKAAALLRKSKRPLILAGNGLVNTFMGQGAISDRSPQSLFTIGLGFRDIVMEAVEAADLVITVGYDIAEYSPDKWNPKNNKTIIHIDFTPAEVYTNYQPAVEIVADINASMRELCRISKAMI